jgi:AAA15 family ATPase/GTPase
MLNSLHIKNYRNLKELNIDSVAQINLITGKNSTGKSTLLEAIAIYASKGDLSYILQLLGDRGEYSKQLHSNIVLNIHSLASLFTGRDFNFGTENSILISGTIDDSTSSAKEPPSGKSIGLRFVKYVEEFQKNEQGDSIVKNKILPDSEIQEAGSCKFGFGVTVDGNLAMLVDIEDPLLGKIRYKNLFAPDRFQFIKTGNIDEAINGKLFDNIALTPKEQYVIDALKIVEPKTERIAFVTDENSRIRNAVIKLSGTDKVFLLKSMGDGANRILTIILALVNAEKGFLLIDEFENGLHYSVQEKLWKIIFGLAKLLHVQVFVTTHSSDCISAFARVVNNPESAATGKLIRLDNVHGNIRQVEFLPEELKVANEQEIEIR